MAILFIIDNMKQQFTICNDCPVRIFNRVRYYVNNGYEVVNMWYKVTGWWWFSKTRYFAKLQRIHKSHGRLLIKVGPVSEQSKCHVPHFEFKIGPVS